MHPTSEAAETAILSLCCDRRGHSTPQLTGEVWATAGPTCPAALSTASGSDAGAETYAASTRRFLSLQRRDEREEEIGGSGGGLEWRKRRRREEGFVERGTGRSLGNVGVGDGWSMDM